ncbi:uncharacterized protein LOC132903349 [Amyelois transitella]|uniref:uncharacterized protein LOC132903349 n=1 Tax=Amyelois transitella TaxID=680683 RepID=UPI00298F63A7|nr:uncharacterized protein LOC132903349 [Amyelois transitella]
MHKSSHYVNKTSSSRSVLTTSRVQNRNNRNNNNSNINMTCPHCNQSHMIYRCDQFRKLSVDDRKDRVRSLKLCTNCLKPDHESNLCKSTITCGVCALSHHYLLHQDTGKAERTIAAAVPPSTSSAQPSPSHTQQALVSSHSVSDRTIHHALHCVDENKYGVVLGTTLTHITDIDGQYQNCRAVLDSGAQSSFITTECAQRLGLPRKKCPFTINGLGGNIVKNQGMISCTIKPKHSDGPTFNVNLIVVSKVSSDMPNVNFPKHVINEYNSFQLADTFFYKKSRIDILLGNDIVPDLITGKPILINSNIPSVIETVFGCVVSGKLFPHRENNSQNFHLSVSHNEECSLDKILHKFWELEEVPCTPVVSSMDQLAENIFVNNHFRESKGQYVVPLPFVTDPAPLGDSRAAAERRLLYTERKLARTPELHQKYNEFMREYEKLDHMERYQGDIPSKYIIPHHSILRPSSASTPLRVVFDGSAKASGV